MTQVFRVTKKKWNNQNFIFLWGMLSCLCKEGSQSTPNMKKNFRWPKIDMSLLVWDPSTRGNLQGSTCHQPCFVDRESGRKSFLYCWRFLKKSMASSDQTRSLSPYLGPQLRDHPSSPRKGRQMKSMPWISEFAVYQVSTPHVKRKPSNFINQKEASWMYNGWKRVQHTI